MKKLFLTTTLLIIIAAPSMAADIQYTIRIDGITCPFCIATSEKALKKIDGVDTVKSNLKDGTITVCADEDKVTLTDEQLTELFIKKGFTYKGMEKAQECKAL